MNFSQIIGYQSIKQKLCKAFTKGKIPQAPLIAGPEGTPVLPFALALATYLHCTNKTSTGPCDTCPHCRKIDKHLHPDLHYTFPLGTTTKKTTQKSSPTASAMPAWREFLTQNPYETLEAWATRLGAQAKQMHINNTQIEETITFLRTYPLQSHCKTIILWLPEHMTPKAANKLLKTLEEPPKNTYIILASHQKTNILPTIASRTFPLNIPPFQDNDLRTALSQKYPHIPLEKREEAAHTASGNLLLAYQLVTQETPPHFHPLSQWLRSLYAQQWEQILDLADAFAKNTPPQQKTYIHYALYIIRTTLLLQQTNPQNNITHTTTHTFCKNLGNTIPFETLAFITQTLESMYAKLQRNAHPKLLFITSSLTIAKQLRTLNHSTPPKS